MRKWLIFLFLCLVQDLGFSQCDPNQFTNTCISRLGTGFNFLKGFPIYNENGKKDKVEYSYVFTKGTQYMINLFGSMANDDIIISLFDSNRNKVAASKIDGQYVTAIVFPCNATGIYYMQYTFKDVSAKCAASVLGFKR